MPVAEEFPHTRNISAACGSWIRIERIERVTPRGKDYELMVLHTDLGRFHATPYIKKQLEGTSEPLGFYDVVAFNSAQGSGFALRNLPPQAARSVVRAVHEQPKSDFQANSIPRMETGGTMSPPSPITVLPPA